MVIVRHPLRMAQVRPNETEDERADRNFGDLLQELRVAQTGVQVLTGFLLTVVTIGALPYLAGAVGWRWTLLLLAPGPVISVVALARLRAPSRSLSR